MSRRNQPFRHHRTRGRFHALYMLLSAVLICAAIVGGSIVFFRVKTIEVSGASRYTRSEIIAASGIQSDENLFLINKFSVVRSMFKRLPYLDTIMIRRRLPDTMVITVTECQPAAVLETQDGDWLMDKQSKLLEQATGDYPRVVGLAPLSPSAGDILALGEAGADNLTALQTLLPFLQEHDLETHVASIDFTEAGRVTLDYDGRLTVYLAVEDDLDYKLRFFVEVLARLNATDYGVVDMTKDEAHFIPA
ncbi:MAG TPA: FtsQ-type POTRA domain-containing protein [Oscillospiraceae bacterium]|nr:FtsQ-type POTRA domain-containing protein [Oscillospiraceae bacterium]